ncbi:hypothetical protein [Paraburkholderia sp. SIMBA_030]|uniref:hypothetical protein n=1 Tax=Paraburkholderia sp. SIMBA_030 TaxID=3085773 RepID=UPI00397CCDB6
MDQLTIRLTTLRDMIVDNEVRMSALVQGLYTYSNVTFTQTPSMLWWRALRRTVRGRA